MSIEKCVVFVVESGQLLLRTYSTMLANDAMGNSIDSNYDSILENAQRTVFLKELFAQVEQTKKKNNIERYVCSVLALSRSIGYYQYHSTDGDEKFHSMLGMSLLYLNFFHVLI